MGNLAFEKEKWELAWQGYEQALLAHEVLLRVALEREGKENELSAVQSLPARAAYALLQMAQPERALEALESGRAQLLREALERNRRDLERLPELGFGELYRRFTQARGREEDLLALTSNRPADWLTQLEAARRELDEAAEEIRRQAGEKDPRYRFFLRPLPFAEIQKQADDAPLIYLAATQHGGFALIVRPQGEPQVVELPQLTEKMLRDQVEGPGKEWGGYLGAYFRWRESLRLGIPQPEQEAARRAWFEALDSALRWLGEAVMSPVLQALSSFLPQGSLARLVPGGLLSLLPLHAALLTVDGGPQTAPQAVDNGPLTVPSTLHRPPSACALDHYTFAYTPSAQALYHARLAAGRPADSLLAVRYPDPRFQLADQAIQAALNVFPPEKCTPLLMEAASRQAVQQAFPAHGVLFFFTHGQARFDEPLQSGLQMAGGGWLTLADIFDLRSERARLAVLAACESGVPSDFENIEEIVSLPSGLMQADVPGVVGTLWTVEESSTAILISIFFEEWRKNGLPPPAALRRAQQIVRDARFDPQARRYFERYLLPSDVAYDYHVELLTAHFSHPFYWSAFTYTGL